MTQEQKEIIKKTGFKIQRGNVYKHKNNSLVFYSEKEMLDMANEILKIKEGK